MARNRKREDVALQWGTLGRSLLASMVIAGLGIGYVQQTIVQDQLGKELGGLEEDARKLDALLVSQREQLTRMKSEAALRRLIEHHRLELTNVPAARRIHLVLPGAAVGTPSGPDIAGRGHRAARPVPAAALATVNASARP